ncbi:MAG TPA: aminotransferase class I/II-fold pyridoxal phosphate-dependent enzyme [Lachnospiraceae bacterium]|nr:aminotransferase class I/II-fold pyridoxal phosphate-dependent enzyme [Lachnospiraceae bacterium]
MYSFDDCPDRRRTGAVKWDLAPEGVIPMWVADMDFAVAPPIEEALIRRVKHPLYGYPNEEAYGIKKLVAEHYRKLYHVEIEEAWIVWVPSVMPGLTMACKMQGGSFLYSVPMYNHIRMLDKETRLPVIEVDLKRNEENQYEMDFDAMEAAVTPACTTFILCNPHNPVGRMYTKPELEKVVDFCKRHHLLLASDEIHCELALNKAHIPAFAINKEAADISITLSSAGKICNIPGLPMGFAVIPNPEIRKRFLMQGDGMNACFHVLSAAAYEKAYDGSCDAWKAELLAYLRNNQKLLEERLCSIPEITIPHNEGTYLSFFDCTLLGEEDPAAFFLREAKVMLSDGAEFGFSQGARLNFGCPKTQLNETLDRIERAVKLKRK